MTKTECPFCSPETLSRAVAYHGSVFALDDKFPVTPGHLLIIPRRHVSDWFGLSEMERRDAESLLLLLRERSLAGDSLITGFNIGMNCGQSAGQLVLHAHIHLIPRRNGDVADPRGGVRGVIPSRQKY